MLQSTKLKEGGIWNRDSISVMEMQNMKPVLLVFEFPLFWNFLTVLPMLPLGMVMYILCLCFSFFLFEACPGTSSCRLGWPQIHRDLPDSASQVLGLKTCATTARFIMYLCM